MHRASCGFMPFRGITETLSDVESVRVVHNEIIRHESDVESRLVESDCTIDGLKQCNEWFINSFSDAGESIFLIQDDYEKVLSEL